MSAFSMHKILLLLPLLSFVGCDMMTPKLVSVCEEVLKERLRSPSSYKRIEVTDGGKEVVTRDIYRQKMIKDGASQIILEANLKDFDEGRRKPRTFRYFITYDASNAYGVPLRDTADCEYLSDYGDESQASRFSVKVDGKTGTDWIIDSIEKTRNR